MGTFKSISISILLFFILWTQATGQSNPSFKIPLKSGTVILEKGKLDTGLLRTMEIVTEEHKYVIVQFEKALKRKKIRELEILGINLLSFLHKNAWICSVKQSSLTETVMKKYAIAAVTPWKAEYKISPELKNGQFQEWAVMESGHIKLLVSFFRDANESVMERLLAQYSSAYEIFNQPNVWAVQMAPNMIDDLIDEPVVQSIEEGPKPFEPLNDLSRSIINVDPIQNVNLGVTPPVYNGLSGKGVHVAVSESVFTEHPDFWEHDSLGNPVVSRFLNPQISGAEHGTHVAGTIGGNGWNSDKDGNTGRPFQWRGMAPEVTLISGSGYGTYPVDASNHSYVMDYGDYNYTTSSVDRDINGGNGFDLRKSHIWAVANQGVQSVYDDEEGYYSIYAPAKNAIGVGAINANDGSLAAFSSLGPTFDGRIKPDIMAGGCREYILTVHIDYIRIIDSTNNTIVRSWEFNTDADFEGWFQVEQWKIADEKVLNGVLSFQVEKDSYGFVENVGLSAKDSHAIEVRYRYENPETLPFIVVPKFWWTLLGSGDYVDGNLEYNAIVDDQFHVVTVPVGQLGWELDAGFNPIGLNGWKGTINRLRIDPLMVGIMSTKRNDEIFTYANACGTSNSAPAVTGTVALMLQQFVEKHGVNLDINPPLPSTIKAILIQTATDLIHETQQERDPNNPDTGTPVLYYEGPDFATGYGLVNAQAAVDLIEAAAVTNLIHESELDVDQVEIYEIKVTSLLPELKVTLAWDDVEASPSLGDQRISRLVNNLDLVLIDPEGNRHYPWRLDPLPIADCGGAGPGCGDLDPIAPSDVQPAYKGTNNRDNVEQVQVENPAIGNWKVCIEGLGIQDVTGGLQSYSLIANEPLSVFRVVATPAIIDLGTLSGTSSFGHDVNVHGQVVGMAEITGDDNRAFLWDDDSMPPMRNLGTNSSRAFGVNDSTQVVGRHFFTGVSGGERPFLWENETLSNLGTLGGNSGIAYDINNSGQVVGFAHGVIESWHAFLWEAGSTGGVPSNPQMHDLGTLGGDLSGAYGINDPGQVVGSTSITDGNQHGFLWDKNRTDGAPSNPHMIDLGTLGGSSSIAFDINDAGRVVGRSMSEGGDTIAFLWDENSTEGAPSNPHMIDLGSLGGTESTAYGINNSDQVVGESWLTGNSGYHAFLWENAVMIDLNLLLPSNTKWELTHAESINNDGWITGWGFIDGKTHAFLIRTADVCNGTVSGSGFYQLGRYRTQIYVSINSLDLSSGMLRYYNSRKRISFISTSIKSVANPSADGVVVTGAGTVNRNPNFTFEATILDSTNTWEITIYDSAGNPYESGSGILISGDLVVTTSEGCGF